MKLTNRAVLLALAAGGLCSQAALADTINVPADFATIQAAINAAAASGDSIVVAPGIYAENLDFLGKSIALTSSGGSGSTTINGSLGFSSTVTIIGSGAGTSVTGFTIVAGPGQADPFDALLTSGGGLYVQDSSLAVNDVVVRDGVTTGRGGGAHFIDSDVSVTGSLFTNNAADLGNLAGARGGGVAISGIGITPNVVFSDTDFTNNTTGNNGGGLSVFSASADLSGCDFSNNVADLDGGGLQVLVGDVTLTDCTFTSNQSVEGGAVHMNTDATGSFTRCTFTGNFAHVGDARGASFYALGTANSDPLGEIIIDDCDFIGNDATGAAGRAGGVYLTRGTTTGDAVATIRNSRFSNNSATEHAGAIYVLFTQPTIENCSFDGNSADVDGGAVYFSSGGGGTWIGCTFTENSANDDGGGLCTLRGVGSFDNCTFDGNSSLDDGGNLGLFSSTAGPSEITITNSQILNGVCFDAGAGLYSLRTGPLVIEGSTFSGNESARGAAIGAFASTSGPTIASITNTVIDGNNSQEGGPLTVSGTDTVADVDRLTITNNTASSFDTGGIIVVNGTLNLSNSLIANNTGTLLGASAISMTGSPTVNVINSTIYGNTNESALGAIDANGTATVVNSIIWNNDGVSAIDVPTATVSHSIIEGGFAGPGNLNTDPMLTSPGGGDYSLSASSPAIDAGDTAQSGGFALDLAGNTRVVDDPATTDTGPGSAPHVDMGAYEFQPTSAPCPGDIGDAFGSPGQDGVVDFGDFLFLLSQAGPCGVPCPGDIGDAFGSPGQDGVVDFGDFLYLLSQAGPCP